MVERMKKLSVLIYIDVKEKFLEGLQELGIVDINIDYNLETEKILNLKREIERIKKAKKFLLEILKDENIKFEHRTIIKNVDEIIERIEKLRDDYESLLQKIAFTDEEIRILEKWGDFDPIAIAKLEENGIFVKFYSASKEEFDKLLESEFAIEKISQIGNTVYFVVFSETELDFPELRLEKVPLKKLSDLKTSREHLNVLETELKLEIKSISAYLPEIDKKLDELSNELFFELTKENLSNIMENKVFYLTGYFPAKNEKGVVEFLEKYDVVYLIEDPAKNENVPIKLKNNRFARLFEVITEMSSLPQYYEVDPTPFTAPFFAMFFGLCVADVGYGLILLVASIGASFFIKNKSLKSIIKLGIVLSISTLILGLMVNTFFGFQILSMPFPEEVKKLVLFTDVNSVMGFSIFLGVLQVIVGYCIRVVNQTRFSGWAGGLQPLGVLLLMGGIIIYGVLYLMEGDLAIGPLMIKKWLGYIPFADVVSGFMIIAGLLLILLFNNLNQKIFLRPLLGLWELYGIVTGIPGDILSYLRLFALGFASGLLGNAFNQIAFMARGDGSNIIGLIGMVLILLVGHSLNLLLGILGAFVHPLRLTLLEFYKAIGFTGNGRKYNPFRKIRSVS